MGRSISRSARTITIRAKNAYHPHCVSPTLTTGSISSVGTFGSTTESTSRNLANAQAFYRKVAETISGNKTVTQADLIRLLNPMLRGWAQYHRSISAKKTYSSHGASSFSELWWWSRRRHPRKSAGWVRRKYFHSADDRKWVFAVHTTRDDGSERLLALYPISGTVIKRHKKVKGDFNAFDPEWEHSELLRRNAWQIRCVIGGSGSCCT